MENILEVKNLCKRYEGFELKNINIELPKGMIMGLIGENGAGKTTTIKSILNTINIDDGEVKIFGLEMQKNELASLSNIQDIAKEYGLSYNNDNIIVIK